MKIEGSGSASKSGSTPKCHRSATLIGSQGIGREKPLKITNNMRECRVDSALSKDDAW
jgi:hypothetical protein